MNVFTRALARDFKTVLGRCVSGRPRGPAPPLVVRFRRGVRTLAATTPQGVTLTYTVPARSERDELLVLPGLVLADVEGETEEPVTLERLSKLTAVVRWADRDGQRSKPIELIPPDRQHDVPDPPSLTPVAGEFLAALHECSRSAARESGRFALSQIQVQGSKGRVIGTDSHFALLWQGFTLPFPDQVLVPPIPVFGSRELARVGEVRVGKTATHLVGGAGPWGVWLPIDTTSRYPDVAALIPRTDNATVAGIDEHDVAVLLGELPKLPGGDEDHRPVTLDLDGGVKVRAADPATKVVREVYLARSPVAGAAQRVALDRDLLKRILALGCHTIRLVDGKPLVAEGDNRTVLVAALDPVLVLPPAKGAIRIATDEPNTSIREPNNPERKTAMKPTPNGHVPPQPTTDPLDPLTAAEDLRTALAEAAAKATRLVAALRAGRKEKKALATVWAGLKQLNLDTPGA